MAVGIHQRNAVWRMLDQSLETAFDTALLVTQSVLFQCVSHCRAQPCQTVFEQVIGCAQFQGRHRSLLAHCARNDDDRNI